jgi:type I restriction enzyme S subunit
MPGKYKVYLEYKNSGTRWLDTVPKDWSLVPLKYLAQFSGGGTPSKDNPDYWNGNIPWVSPKDMKTSTIISTIDNVTEKAVEQSSTKLLNKGALLVVVRSGILQHSIPVAINNIPVTLNQDIRAVHFNSRLNAKYAMYIIAGSQAALLLEWRKQGATVESIEQDYLANTIFPVPSVEEQNQITQFLDDEIEKIDSLIERQRQLIQLLKEKRQAIISQAVTKGLNSSTKMRNSGVEWLGEIPEHWVVTQLKFNTLEMQTGPFGSQLHAEDYVVDGIPLVNPAHMKDGKIVPDSKVSVDENTWSRLSRHQLFEGDLIFARRGELGRCAVVTKGEEGWLCGTGSLKAKLNERLIPEYSYLLITSSGVISELSLESKGSTMDNLNTETLGRVRLPVPPVGEQRGILSYVKNVSGKYGLLIDKANSAIELMQERRTALISAAVTGKIDVRDWGAQKLSQTNKEVAA